MINKNILYFTRTMDLGGTEKVILQLCEIMKSDANKIVVCSCGGRNVDKLTKLGIKHYKITDIEQKNLKVIFNVIKTLLDIIKKEDINIIHTHHRMAAFYARVLRLIKKFTFVHSAHNTFTDKKLMTRFALKTSNIIAVGNKVKDNLCKFYGIPESKVVVIHNAVEQFEGPIEPIVLLKNFKDKGYFLVGNIGRLSEQKGMEYFVKAIPRILGQNNKIKFFIAGDGEYKDKIKDLISSLCLDNDVFLLGYINDIQNVMSQLDLIVLSSLWEGLPLTPIEAFSVGKTIVATSVDGTVEVVDDGINGILIEPKDSQEIANAIIKIYNSPEKLKKLENNAYKTYKEKFSYDVLIKKYREFYKKIME